MITFKDTGTYEIKMTNLAIKKEGMEWYETPEVYATINVTKDARLSDISVSTGELKPAFSKSVFDYRVDVPRDTTEITIRATALDSNTIISGDTGLYQLRIGSNNFTITATSGQTTWNYNVLVYRSYVVDIMEVTDDLQITNYEVYDILGRLLLSQQSHMSLDNTHLPTGIYILKMATTKGIITKKFFIY